MRTSAQATFTRYTWSLDFFFTINEIFKEFQGGVIVLDSTHSTSVASKIVSLRRAQRLCNLELRLRIANWCRLSAYVSSRIAPQNRSQNRPYPYSRNGPFAKPFILPFARPPVRKTVHSQNRPLAKPSTRQTIHTSICSMRQNP